MSDFASIIANLDALSRTRALTMDESIRLERAIREEQRARPRFEFGAAPIRLLAEKAAEITGTPAADVFGRPQYRKAAYTRFAAMKVASEHGKPTTLIGRVFNRDHSTVFTALNRAAELESVDPDFAALLGTLREEAGR